MPFFVKMERGDRHGIGYGCDMRILGEERRPFPTCWLWLEKRQVRSMEIRACSIADGRDFSGIITKPVIIWEKNAIFTPSFVKVRLDDDVDRIF